MYCLTLIISKPRKMCTQHECVPLICNRLLRRVRNLRRLPRKRCPIECTTAGDGELVNCRFDCSTFGAFPWTMIEHHFVPQSPRGMPSQPKNVEHGSAFRFPLINWRLIDGDLACSSARYFLIKLMCRSRSRAGVSSTRIV